MDRDTIIILGDSPFVASLQEKLPAILRKFYSIGINNIITKYYTNEHIFQDKHYIPLTNKFIGKTITAKCYGELIPKENKYLIDSFSFNFRKDTEHDICKGDKVAWCGFTHDYAISYCIKQGYKHIILIGAGDFERGPHFSHKYTFKCSQTLKKESKKFIEDYVAKVVDIRTTNPNSYLAIPRISIDDLLKI